MPKVEHIVNVIYWAAVLAIFGIPLLCYVCCCKCCGCCGRKKVEETAYQSSSANDVLDKKTN